MPQAIAGLLVIALIIYVIQEFWPLLLFLGIGAIAAWAVWKYTNKPSSPQNQPCAPSPPTYTPGPAYLKVSRYTMAFGRQEEVYTASFDEAVRMAERIKVNDPLCEITIRYNSPDYRPIETVVPSSHNKNAGGFVVVEPSKSKPAMSLSEIHNYLHGVFRDFYNNTFIHNAGKHPRLIFINIETTGINVDHYNIDYLKKLHTVVMLEAIFIEHSNTGVNIDSFYRIFQGDHKSSRFAIEKHGITEETRQMHGYHPKIAFSDFVDWVKKKSPDNLVAFDKFIDYIIQQGFAFNEIPYETKHYYPDRVTYEAKRELPEFIFVKNILKELKKQKQILMDGTELSTIVKYFNCPIKSNTHIFANVAICAYVFAKMNGGHSILGFDIDSITTGAKELPSDVFFIWYADYHGNITNRYISNLGLGRTWGEPEETFDYKIGAYCHLRNEDRNFHLDRIFIAIDPRTRSIIDVKKLVEHAKANASRREEILKEDISILLTTNKTKPNIKPPDNGRILEDVYSKLYQVFTDFYKKNSEFGSLCFFDIKTARDEIIDFSALYIKHDGVGVKIDVFTQIILGTKKSHSVIITDAIRINKGHPPKKTYYRFAEWVRKRAPKYFVAYNAGNTKATLLRNMERNSVIYGMATNSYWYSKKSGSREFKMPDFLCMITMIRELKKNGVKKNIEFETVAKRLKYPVQYKRSTLDNVEICAYIFAKMPKHEIKPIESKPWHHYIN